MVITGDNKSTAEAICREIGIFCDGEDLKGKSFTGKEFMALGSSQQAHVLSRGGGLVFSRAEPRHKQDIVRMLKDLGEIVAMTGDGVNDAPALKLADIGVSMGIAGTEVRYLLLRWTDKGPPLYHFNERRRAASYHNHASNVHRRWPKKHRT